MRGVEGLNGDHRCHEGTGLRYKEFLRNGGLLLRIAVKEVLRTVRLHVAVTLRRKVPEAPADVSGQLLHRAQSGLSGGIQLHEAAVLAVPDLVFHPDLIAHLHRVSGLDLLPHRYLPILIQRSVVVQQFFRHFLIELALNGEAVPRCLDLRERSLIGGR